MMKKLYFLFMLLVGLNSVYSQAAFNSPTTPILTIGTITDAVPGAIVVPVHAANIVNLGAFQFAIEYDPAIMTYTGTSNWYTGIEAVTIGNPLSGHLTFVWASDAQEINIPDNIFFNLNFTYISGTSAVTGAIILLPGSLPIMTGISLCQRMLMVIFLEIQPLSLFFR